MLMKWLKTRTLTMYLEIKDTRDFRQIVLYLVDVF